MTNKDNQEPNLLAFWERFEQTDPDRTRKFNVSQQTRVAVSAQYKKKMITKGLGMFGRGWGVVVDSENYERVHYENSTCLLHYTAKAFYVYEGERFEFPIAASIRESYITNGGKGYLLIDDEAVKKVRTDALTKGFTDLGFCSDIHMGMFDDQAYVEAAMVAHDLRDEENKESVLNNDLKSWVMRELEAASEKVSDPEQRRKVISSTFTKFVSKCQAFGLHNINHAEKYQEFLAEFKQSKSNQGASNE